GEHVVAGKVEINQARQLVLQEEDVVGEQVGVDNAGRQVVRPRLLQMRQLGRDVVAQSCRHSVGPGGTCCEQRLPAVERQGVGSPYDEVGGGQMQARQRFANGGAVLR